MAKSHQFFVTSLYCIPVFKNVKTILLTFLNKIKHVTLKPRKNHSNPNHNNHNIQ